MFVKKSYLSSWVFTPMQSLHIRMNLFLSPPPKKILDPPMLGLVQLRTILLECWEWNTRFIIKRKTLSNVVHKLRTYSRVVLRDYLAMNELHIDIHTVMNLYSWFLKIGFYKPLDLVGFSKYSWRHTNLPTSWTQIALSYIKLHADSNNVS